MTGTSVESNNGCDQLRSFGLHLASTDQVSRMLAIQNGRYSDSPAGSAAFSSSSSMSSLSSSALSSTTRSPSSFSAPWADGVFADWQKSLPPDLSTAEKLQKPKFKFSTFYNPTKERAKEARLRNSHAVPLVFVRRGKAASAADAGVGRENNRSAAASMTTTTTTKPGLWDHRSKKRKRNNLVDSDSVLNQIFDDENNPTTRNSDEDRRREAEDNRSYDDDDDSRGDETDFDASQYCRRPSPDSKKPKRDKSSIFDLM